jgi:hypothetical protein
VKTRTLLILSALTASAILIAGIALFIVWSRADEVSLLAVGDTGRAGDAVVTPTAVAGADGITQVGVTVSGVDDPSGFDDFGVVSAGVAYPVAGSTCDGLTVAPQDCELTFDVDLASSPGVLVFRRADTALSWRLTRDTP